jgi:hypothetical protein
MSWMAVLDGSPPPSVSMPEAKKSRSGMVPRGVRTYLRAIARDTVDSCRPSSAAMLAQGERAQRLFAELEERGLLADQAAHHPQQRVAARFQSLQQPARFLQATAQVIGIAVAGVRIICS